VYLASYLTGVLVSGEKFLYPTTDFFFVDKMKKFFEYLRFFRYN